MDFNNFDYYKFFNKFYEKKFQGVNTEDCQIISRLIGTKIFINEFVAYAQLGGIVNARNAFIANNTFDLYRNGTMMLDTGTAMIWNVK